MRTKTPDNWQPPEQQHAGENLAQFFAQMFVGDMLAQVMVATGRFDAPLVAEALVLGATVQDITELLISTGAYQLEGGYTLFTTFHVLRDTAFANLGHSLGEKNPDKAASLGQATMLQRYHMDMTLKEALKVSEEFVATWGWRQ